MVALFASALTVHGSFPAGRPISPYVTGQNFWFNPPDSAYPIIMDSGVTMMRIGGKAYDDNPILDAALLKQVDNIRSIGAEPLVQVSRHKGPAAAAAMVTFLNIDNARAVRYWAIGNEPDLNYVGGEAALAAEVEIYTKAISPAMRDVDPTINISSSDMAFYSTTKFGLLLGGANDITGRDSQGRYYVDCINFHRYPFGSSFTRAQVLNEIHTEFETRVLLLLGNINVANTLHGRTGAEALTWGLTEYNMTYSNPSTATNHPAGLGVSSFLNGHLFAEYFRVGMKHGVNMMNTWSLLEGGAAGAPGDLGYVGGSWAAPVKRSSYYHMQMTADYLIPGGYLAGTSTTANLAVLSTSSSDQAMLSVMLLNEENTSNLPFTLRLNEDAVSGTGPKINVAAGLAQEYSGIMDSQSTAVLLFDVAGTLKQRITYSLSRNVANLPPVVETFSGAVIDPTPPAEVVAVSGNTTAALFWTPSSEAMSYTVKRGIVAGGPYAPIATGVITASYTDFGLTNGTSYFYVVSASNALGESTDSFQVTGLPQPVLPEMGFSIEAEALTRTTSPGWSAVQNNEAAASGGAWIQLNATSSAAIGSFVEFTTTSIPAGTYDLRLTWKSNTNRGQMSMSVDGVTIGTLDQYGTGTTFPTRSIGAVTFATAGTHLIRMTSTGKQPAAGTYLLSADKFSFISQAGVAAATIVLNNLDRTYDGTSKSATAATTPLGLATSITYDGSTTAPIAAGAYTVVAKITAPGYVGTTSSTLVINEAPATVTLGDLDQVHDGSPKAATATTSPEGLDVLITYDGSTTAPSEVGTYEVVGTVISANYTGEATGTLTIADTTPPVIESLKASLTSLWPADHRMVAITVDATVTDNDKIEAEIRILTVTSNEPDNGVGDGDTVGDTQITGPMSLDLRAERAGMGAGRVYTITVEARDAAGNATARTVTVEVPKSQV